jgi:hypothetical protein
MALFKIHKGDMSEEKFNRLLDISAYTTVAEVSLLASVLGLIFCGFNFLTLLFGGWMTASWSRGISLLFAGLFFGAVYLWTTKAYLSYELDGKTNPIFKLLVEIIRQTLFEYK